MSEPFRRGDIVRVAVCGCPTGFFAVMKDQASDRGLELHDGGHGRCSYFHAGWCRKVGEVGEDVLAECEANHEEMKALDDEREERRRAYEASEAKKAEKIAEDFGRLSDRYKAEVARAIRAFDAYTEGGQGD